MKDAIYTFTGDILISINPYCAIPGLYDIPDGELRSYEADHLPHVYSIAEKAYHTMMKEEKPTKKNQSLIVSGESGAGKTEACKHIMRYLARLSERYNADRADAGVGELVKIEKKVLDCNPFLEVRWWWCCMCVCVCVCLCVCVCVCVCLFLCLCLCDSATL